MSKTYRPYEPKQITGSNVAFAQAHGTEPLIAVGRQNWEPATPTPYPPAVTLTPKQRSGR